MSIPGMLQWFEHCSLVIDNATENLVKQFYSHSNHHRVYIFLGDGNFAETKVGQR